MTEIDNKILVEAKPPTYIRGYNSGFYDALELSIKLLEDTRQTLIEGSVEYLTLNDVLKELKEYNVKH